MNTFQQELLAQLEKDIFNLESQLEKLKKRLVTLSMTCSGSNRKSGDDYTAEEIEGLLRFNQCLSTLEKHLQDLGQTQNKRMMEKVATLVDPTDDYEIEVTLHFILREGDWEFDEDEDNFLATRCLSLKCGAYFEMIDDGQDHKDPGRKFPGALQEVPHCRLFFDLYTYSHGFNQRKLSLKDCLRIGRIWVDVAVQHQATLNIETGLWEKPIFE